jgi:integrase
MTTACTTMTLSELATAFDAGSLVEGATKKKCRTAWRKWLELIGDVPAEQVDALAIQRYQAGMVGRGFAVASVRSYFASLSAVYSWGVEMKFLEVNPWLVARKIRPTHQEVQTYAPEQIARLANAAAHLNVRDPTARLRWTAIINLAIESGLRIGEIVNLRWEDIDLVNDAVHIVYRGDCWGEFWQWGTKGKTDRSVPLGGDTLDALCRLGVVAKWRYPLLKRVTCLRLQDEVGRIPEHIRKLPYINFHREFRKIRALAGMSQGGLHVGRKTAATRWAARDRGSHFYCLLRMLGGYFRP